MALNEIFVSLCCFFRDLSGKSLLDVINDQCSNARKKTFQYKPFFSDHTAPNNQAKNYIYAYIYKETTAVIP